LTIADIVIHLELPARYASGSGWQNGESGETA